MIKALTWLAGVTVLALLIAPLLLVEPFVRDIGEPLQTKGLLAGIAVVAAIAGSVYVWGRGERIAAWRVFYVAPTILLGFLLYANTGSRWLESRAAASARPREQLAALGSHAPPGPPPEWVARVHRDVAIWHARDEYYGVMSRLGYETDVPLPRAVTPWLVVGMVLFILAMLQPAQRIEAVFQ